MTNCKTMLNKTEYVVKHIYVSMLVTSKKIARIQLKINYLIID